MMKLRKVTLHRFGSNNGICRLKKAAGNSSRNATSRREIQFFDDDDEMEMLLAVSSAAKIMRCVCLEMGPEKR